MAAADSAAPPFDDAMVTGHLGCARWTHGMQNAFLEEFPRIAMRYIIVDDSGSMYSSDGSMLQEYEGTYE